MLGPNILGQMTLDRLDRGGVGNFWGCLTYNGKSTNDGSTQDYNNKSSIIGFNASNSNSIYGNSNTVQPASLCFNYVIKA